MIWKIPTPTVGNFTLFNEIINISLIVVYKISPLPIQMLTALLNLPVKKEMLTKIERCLVDKQHRRDTGSLIVDF